MNRIYPVPMAPASMMLGASPTHRQAMANVTAQSTTTTPLSSASMAVASVTTVTAPRPTFDFAFYDMASSPSSAARFSTDMGHSPRRSIAQSVEDRPFPIVRSDPGKAVLEKVEALQNQYPDFVRRINEPRRYTDMYHYFDGYDLWIDGVLFCWQVIAAIGNRNTFLNRLADNEIDQYAAQWVLYHEDRVICHPEMGDLTALFNIDELADLDALLPGQLAKLKAKLLVYRDKLLIDYRKKPKWESRPTLYPVIEGREHPHDPQSIGSRGIMPPLALLPVSHTAGAYGRFQGQQRPAGTWPNRPRGTSRVSDIGRLSRKGSPQRDEPIYVYNGSSERPLESPTSNRTLSRVSGDVRVSGLEGLDVPPSSAPDAVYPYEKEGFNGALTFHYGPKCIDDNNASTVYIAPIARELYATHELKRLMSQCGEVENVHYPFAENGHGPAFVKFTTTDSAEKAIRLFEKYQLPTGVTISASHPRPRIRSNSNATQKISFRTPRDFQEFNPNGPRRQTFRQRAYSNNGPNCPTAGETFFTGIQSQASEIVQHQAAMDRLPLRSMMDKLPLASIENLPPKPQIRSNIQESSKKENSPMKPTPANSPPKEPEGQKPSRSGKGKKGRGNKQNTPTRPTPASTPVRSMSVAQLSDMIENPPPQMALLQEMKQLQQEDRTAQAQTAPLSLDTSSGPAQNNKPRKKKNKNSSAKSLSTSPSFVTDGSESFQSPTEAGGSDSFTSKSSPTDAGTTDSFASQSANASHTNLSSRKQSLASGASDTSLMLEMSLPATADGPESKQRVQVGKSRKPSHQNHSKKENSLGNAAQTNVPIQQNKIVQQIQPKNATHESAQVNQLEQEKDTKIEQKDQQKEAKKENTPKTRSKDTEQPKNKKDNDGQNQAKKDTHGKPDTKENQPPKTSKHDIQAKPNTKENEPPKTSKKEDAGSQRKADAKSGGTKKSSDASPASQNVSANVAQSPPKQVLADPTEWPALNPSASPQSAIADGKRSPPLSAPALRLPVHAKPIVPAVPVMPRKPRPQPIDLHEVDPPAIPELDSNYPPFVEEFDYPWENMRDLPPPGPLGGPDWPFVKSFRESID